MLKQLAFFLLLLLIACGGESQTPENQSADAQEVAEVSEGEKIFKLYCIVCHGIDGKLALNGAKDLTISEMTIEERRVNITEGKNLMTPFKGILNDEQIKQVAEYTMTLK
jgi:mono/diheme cytochrome c family protein